jgi:DNA-binding response OmpR family regulator
MLVALTGWGQDSDRRRSREAGFDLHLVKPLDMGRLTEVLRRRPAAASAAAGE